MEIQVYNPTHAQPLPAITWNYLEVKQWVEAGLQDYKGRVYDGTQIAEAKKDRASLNKLATAIDDKRKEMKAMYLAPYEQFEAEAKELVAMIKTVSAEIDAQVKVYDDLRKQEKQQQIEAEIYTPLIGNLSELIPYGRLHNPKWLNVTTGMDDIRNEMAQTVNKIEKGLKSIDKLNLTADIAERVKSVFLKDFDLAAAIAEKDQIAAEHEKMERYRVTQAPVAAVGAPEADEKVYTVTFRIQATKAQLDGLRAYMKANDIKPERV